MPANMYPQYIPQNDVDQEYKIYEALRDNLDENYHVFHSLDIMCVDKNHFFYRSEADFVIFHPQKGMLVIEAKNGSNISFKGKTWYYTDGTPMNHGGPFTQSENNKRNLIKLIEKYNENLKSNCKFLHAVWFHGMEKDRIKKINFPPNVDVDLLLSKEDLNNPKQAIDRIFDIRIRQGYDEIVTKLTNKEADIIVKKILYPEFCGETKNGLEQAEYVFSRLLEEQERVLYFLEEQKTALINGLAGSGKTFVALRKAKNEADKGQKVLFLCYNARLNKTLSQKHKHDNIDFYTLDAFAKAKGAIKNINTGEGDYDKLYDILDKNRDDFEYKHVVVDEGQDFFESDGAMIINILYEIMQKNNGSFYLFYDKNQLIQYNYANSKKENIHNEFLEYVKDPDCKLTLYRNCRNTKDIAKTSTRIFSRDNDAFKKSVLFDYNCELRPQIYIDTDNEANISKLKEVIKTYKEYSKDIIVLTCGNLTPNNTNSSFLSSYVSNGYFEGVEVTTCRKFKGCEADIVIVIDINKKNLMDLKERLLYYEGTTRAKYGLSLFCNLTEEDCKEVVCFLDNEPKFTSKRLGKFVLANKLNAEYIP